MFASLAHKIGMTFFCYTSFEKNSEKRIYRVIFKARQILVYTEVHEFFEPVENGSRKLLYEFLKKNSENSTDRAISRRGKNFSVDKPT